MPMLHELSTCCAQPCCAALARMCMEGVELKVGFGVRGLGSRQVDGVEEGEGGGRGELAKYLSHLLPYRMSFQERDVPHQKCMVPYSHQKAAFNACLTDARPPGTSSEEVASRDEVL